MRNLYKVLGIASTADDLRIKSAFRRRAKAVHPDLNPGSRRAEARFIELMQAYKVLSDANHRATYDAHLAEQRSLARRRFAHCAGLMMTSFVLTTASVLLAMIMAGADVPYRDTWRLAVAALSPAEAKAPAAAGKQDTAAGWTTQVAVARAPASAGAAVAPGRAEPAHDAKPKHDRYAKVESRPVAAPPKGPNTKSRQSAPPAKEQRQQVAAAAKAAPVPAKGSESAAPPASEETWWLWPAAEEPRYSLGASDLR